MTLKTIVVEQRLMDGAQPVVDSYNETVKMLTSAARQRFGKISESRIAEHLMHQMGDAEWVVLKAALDALARRYSFAQRDGLALASRPPRDAGLGTYRTHARQASRASGTRPYETAVLALTPLRMSCSCTDFVRSSLGLCKHGLVVLEMLETRGAFARRSSEAPHDLSSAMLTWSSHQPALGAIDRLARLQLTMPKRRSAPFGWKDGLLVSRVLRDPKLRLNALGEVEKLIERGALDAEPAVIKVLAEERERAQRAADSERGASDAVRALGTLKRKLYSYQREGVRRFFATGRLLLADDMGLGKTTQAIAACHGLYATGRVQRGLLIVPAALKGQWIREWEVTTDAPITLVEGSPSERARQYAKTKRGYLVIGYEQLLRDFAMVVKLAPELVVLDEAQRIKNWATKSAAYVKALEPRYRLVLTGTPMENRLDELASIMDFVDDLALEPKWRLTPFHSRAPVDGERSSSGARHLSALRARLSPVMVRRVRQEVLSQLPARVDTRVPIELTAVQREAHEDLRRPIAYILQSSAKRPLQRAEFLQLMSLLTRQRMICNGMAQVQFAQDWPRCQAEQPTPAFLQSLFMPKLSVLRGILEQVVIGQRRKAVVFSQWRNMVRLSAWAVSDLLAAAGLRAVFFTGAESASAREQALVEFHDDKSAAVMFLTDAGGVGLNLQRAASCCVNLELPWNPAVLEQRIGRIYRLGQRAPIDVYNLVSEEGIESRIAALVARKQAVFAGLFDGTSDEVVFEGRGSFLEGLTKLVDPVEVPLPDAAEVDPQEPELVAQAAPAPEPSPPTAALVEGLVIEKLDDGSLRIAAPPQLAAPLASLFEQLARGLRTQEPERAGS